MNNTALLRTALIGTLSFLLSSAVARTSETTADVFPQFERQGIAVDHKNLRYNPADDLIFPSVIRADVFERPLGKYYLYYAPHDAPGGICLAYADHLCHGNRSRTVGLSLCRSHLPGDRGGTPRGGSRPHRRGWQDLSVSEGGTRLNSRIGLAIAPAKSKIRPKTDHLTRPTPR
jgi:hypothetical protein